MSTTPLLVSAGWTRFQPDALRRGRVVLNLARSCLLRGALKQPRRVLLLGRNPTLSAVRRELRARGRAPETIATFDASVFTAGVSDVVIDPTIAYPHRVQVALLELAAQGVAVHTAADIYEGLTRRALLMSGSVGVVAPDRFGGTPYIAVRRLVEVLVAAFAILLTAPLLLVLCVAVMIDSPGSPLYRQERVGLNGRNFRMVKLRTMRQYAELNGRAVWARANDPRVTRVGSMLRRSRLDELPQLWNVLRGDMSLIGPRPERPDFVAVLDRRLPLYHARHAVRPGITGWAQVQQGYTATMKGALTKLEYDLYYIRHRTALLDLAIVLKTLIVVLRLEGR
jgi:lipopolysaccharide/colanic/teichoic acid biosynthesis glycosyltransferase